MGLCETCGTICPFYIEHVECDNHTPKRSSGMKTCKNCEWAGYCTFDDNAVMCERDGSEYIPANKMQEVAEKCIDYRELKQPHEQKGD